MKQFFVGLALVPVMIGAQPVVTTKQIICDKSKNVLEIVTKQFGESPIWMGNGEKLKSVIFANPKTHTWTMIQFLDDTACVIDAGEGFNIKLTGSKETI